MTNNNFELLFLLYDKQYNMIYHRFRIVVNCLNGINRLDMSRVIRMLNSSYLIGVFLRSETKLVR